MRLRSRFFVLVGSMLGGVAFSQPAAASCLALSRFPNFVDCRAVIAPPFQVDTLHVVAALFGDAATQGITGAEFRVEGFPTTWFPIASVDPGATATGNPLGTGSAVAFFGCQAPPNGVVHLFSIVYFPTDAAVHNLVVTAASPPADPAFDCPVMRLCGESRPRLCVSGGWFRFNNIDPCELGVEPASWSQVKALYD